MKNRKTIIFSILTLIFIITLFIIKHLSDFEKKYSERSEKILFQEALSLFNNTKNTFEWLSTHGPIYIKESKQINPNPYFDDSIYDLLEEKLVKVNPASIVKGITQRSNEKGNYFFKIVSSKPINPNNSPDLFEKRALESIKEKKVKFYTNFQDEKYNFVAPLEVQPTCIRCHNHVAYKPGDIIGGIRISIPAQAYKTSVDIIKDETNNLYLLTIITSIIIMVIITITLNNLYAREYNTRKINRLLEKKVKKRTKELSLANEELKRVATIDPLTNIPNRRYFFEASQKSFYLACREEKPFSIICIDIDLFKKINDSYGHLVGDEVLKLIAKTLNKSIRKSDVLARTGGEEFVILLQNTNLENALHLAEKIRQKVENIKYNDIQITISLGVSEIDFIYDRSVDTVFAKADEALYKAKDNGRNRVES